MIWQSAPIETAPQTNYTVTAIDKGSDDVKKNVPKEVEGFNFFFFLCVYVIARFRFLFCCMLLQKSATFSSSKQTLGQI